MYEPPQGQPEQPPQPPAYPPSADHQAPFAAPPPPAKRGAGKVIGIVLGVLVALLCCCVMGVAVAWNSDFGREFRESFTEEITDEITEEITDTSPRNATVGDCLTRTVEEDASDAKVVDCASPEAVNKVIGVIPGVTEASFDRDHQALCDEDFPEWENVLWFGQTGGIGRVLCVAPKQ